MYEIRRYCEAMSAFMAYLTEGYGLYKYDKIGIEPQVWGQKFYSYLNRIFRSSCGGLNLWINLQPHYRHGFITGITPSVISFVARGAKDPDQSDKYHFKKQYRRSPDLQEWCSQYQGTALVPFEDIRKATLSLKGGDTGNSYGICEQRSGETKLRLANFDDSICLPLWYLWCIEETAISRGTAVSKKTTTKIGLISQYSMTRRKGHCAQTRRQRNRGFILQKNPIFIMWSRSSKDVFIHNR